MNQQLLDYIKILSLKDKKTLMGKLAKTTEEVGELARVIQPFDNAHGTLHRFVTRQNILEEVADVMLAVMSIAYSLGYEDSDIEDMVYNKSLYWNEKQLKEQKIDPDKIPFEIHVTI